MGTTCQSPWVPWARTVALVFVAVCFLLYISMYSAVFSELSLVSPYHEQQQQPQLQQRYQEDQFNNLTLLPPPSVIKERRTHLEETCRKLSVPNSRFDTKSRFLIVRSAGIALCYVPKVGCTFWKRVFLALQHNHSDIFKLTKAQAHTMPIDTLNRIPNFDARHAFLSKATRVMFVRDPYSRLYSAYVDKFFLIEFGARAKAIIKKVRLNSTADALSCGIDLTFAEFLKYALEVARREHIEGGDEHWFPINKLCHPCTFNFDIIGKQETFSADRNYVLDMLGIRSVLTKQTISPEVVARDGMKQTIDMSWSRVSRCISRKELAGRMWKSYIDQGYIHHSHSFPEKRVTNTTSKEEFLGMAMEAYSIKTPTSEERQKQRRDAMVKAYSRVPLQTLIQIQNLFRLDFDLFGYPLRPEDLFPPSSSKNTNGSRR